jgi:hypothetical protein
MPQGIIPTSPDNPLDTSKLSYYGVVAWLNELNPFADNGDSGSLVYLQLGERKVPIGIHQGSVGTTSYC